jgi:O-antigen/teichoic acid export membrane protein
MDVIEADAKLNLSRLVARNTAVQLGGRVLTMALALASLMVLTRYLGVEGVGDYLLVISLLTLLNFSDMGLLLITVRELSTAREDPDVLIGNVLVIRVVTALLSMVMTVGVALALDYPPDVTLAIIIGSLSYLAIAIGTGSLGASFIANLRMEFAVLASLAQFSSFLVFVGIVVALSAGLISLVVAYNISMFLGAAVVVFFSRRFTTPRLKLDWGLCRRIIISAIPAGLSTVAWILYSRLGMVMLSQMDDSEAVAFYGLAYRFIEVAYPVGFFFVGSVYPILSRHFSAGEGPEFRWLHQRATDIITLLALGPITILVVFAEPILNIVASSDFEPAANTLRIVGVAIFPLWLALLSSYTLLSMEKQVTLLWIGLTALAVNVTANILLIPSMSNEGSAVATLVTEITALTLMLVAIRRQLHYVTSFRVTLRMAPILAMAGLAAMTVAQDSLPGQLLIVAVGLVAAYIVSGAISIKTIRALISPSPQPEVEYATPGEIGAGR